MPGLLRGVVRTAAVAGTATAVSNRVSRRQGERWAAQDAAAYPHQGTPLLVVGDSKRFTRQDSVEQAWRVMQPLLDAPPTVHPYEKGSWGPPAGNDLVAADGGWRGPWVAT